MLLAALEAQLMAGRLEGHGDEGANRFGAIGGQAKVAAQATRCFMRGIVVAPAPLAAKLAALSDAAARTLVCYRNDGCSRRWGGR